jgi:hypothetical protein
MTSHKVTHIPWPPKIGMVIGTYGSVSYIRLQLETRKLYWPEVEVLIHDDNSDKKEELIALCEQYGATYYSTPKRLVDGLGDMAAIVEGLDWAKRNNIDLLVKLSRRFLITHPWTLALSHLAYNTQHPTYAGQCAEYMKACRSEAIVFHVESWIGSEPVEAMRKARQDGHAPSDHMETWYGEKANEIFQQRASMRTRSTHAVFHVKSKAIGCMNWPIEGFSRHTRAPGLIWHNADFPEAYLYCARSYGFNDISLDELRWIYNYNSDEFVHYPEPPLAHPAFSSSQSEIAHLRERFLAIGFTPIEDTSEYKSALAQGKRAPNLNSLILEKKVENRIERSIFDIIRWIRTITWQPYIASRTLCDTMTLSSIWNKASINDAVAEPRQENFAQFICEKASEQAGVVLVIGAFPTGLARHAALNFRRRLHIFAVSKGATMNYLAAATAALNAWDNISVYSAPKNDVANSWIETLQNTEICKTSLILINMAGNSSRIVRALKTVIERDSPQILICEQNMSKPPADDLRELQADLARFGYACSTIPTDGDCDGVFRQFDPNATMKRRAVYAWKTV